MVVPATVAQAQTAGGFNLGIADRADTSALEVTLRLAWGHETGPALEGSAGVDWAIGHGTPYDILDADVGYAAVFGAHKRMRVLIRGGASWWGRNDRTDGLGENGAIEL